MVGVVAPSVTGHSHGLGDHGLAIVSGLVHASAAAAWLGTLVAVAWHTLRRDPGQRTMLPRYSRLVTIALIAGLLVAASLEAFAAVCLGCIAYAAIWGCADCDDLSERLQQAMTRARQPIEPDVPVATS